MISPGKYDLWADRWVACIRTFSFVGINLTGATFQSEIRLYPDAPGVPLVALATVTTASAEGVRLIGVVTDTVANFIASGRLEDVPPGYHEGDTITISDVGYRVNATTMQGLPFPPQRGDNNFLAWDLQITPAGGIEDKFMGGAFVVRPGATE